MRPPMAHPEDETIEGLDTLQDDRTQGWLASPVSAYVDVLLRCTLSPYTGYDVLACGA